MATTRSYFIPGFGYVNEVKGNAHLVPGWGYINETVSPAVTTSVVTTETSDSFSSSVLEIFILSSALIETADALSSASAQTIKLNAALQEGPDVFAALVQYGNSPSSGTITYYHKKRGQPGTIMRGTGGPQGGTVP